MRLLTRDEVELIWTIDRSEVHHHIYDLRDGQLVCKPSYFEMPRWTPDAVEKETPVLLDCFDGGGTFLGVFDAEARSALVSSRALALAAPAIRSSSPPSVLNKRPAHRLLEERRGTRRIAAAS